MCQRSKAGRAHRTVVRHHLGDCNLDLARLGHHGPPQMTMLHSLPSCIPLCCTPLYLGCPVRPTLVCNVATGPSLMLSAALKLFSPTHSIHSELLLLLLSCRCAVWDICSRLCQQPADYAEHGHCCAGLLLHHQICYPFSACPSLSTATRNPVASTFLLHERHHTVSILCVRPTGYASAC